MPFSLPRHVPLYRSLRALLIAAACGHAGVEAPAPLQTPPDPEARVQVAAHLRQSHLTCTWDPAAGVLRCVRGSSTVLLHEGIPFVNINGTLSQIPARPEMAAGQLVLPPAGMRQVVRLAGIDSVLQRDTVTAPSPSSSARTGDDAAPPSPPATADTAGGSRSVAKGSDRSSRGAPANAPSAIKILVIDPGHGGKDPGAIGRGGTREKDVTLAVALKLRDILAEKTDGKIYMTRDRDTYVRLQDRTRFANERKADLFVSLHANAVPGPKKRMDETRGYKVYFLSQAKNEEDRLAAMQENAVVELEEEGASKDYLQNILADLIVNEYLMESQDLSILLSETFDRSLKKVRKLHQGVGQANFWVLNGARMPSVLVEMAFISQLDEEKLLADPGFQRSLAEAIASAVLDFREKFVSR